MIINLNGGLSINENDYYFDELEIEIIEDEFDCDIEDYTMDCEEYGFCDDEDEEYDDFDLCDLLCPPSDEIEIELDSNLDALLDAYIDVMDESCGCIECTKEILLDLIKDFMDLLIE